MRAAVLLPLLSLALASLVSAAERPKDPKAGTLSLYFENDLFAGTDRYYTNGVKLGWTSTDLGKFSDTPYASPLLPVLDRLPFINGRDYQKNLAFSLGQNIYTPDDTEATQLLTNDRPYAGWLYLGVGIIWKNAEARHSLNLNLGVVGSYSLAEEAQTTIHRLRGFESPKGWDNQLHNEFGAVLTYEYTWRWPRHERRVGFDWEFLPHAGLAVGNVQIYANVGGELRVGLNLPDDFGTAGISPSSTTSTPLEGNQQSDRLRIFDLGAYVFARADGRAVAHNIFLDGNTFGNSPSVTKKPFVADLTLGASVNYRNTKLTYALTYRSAEFDGQKAGGQVFGSVSLSVEL